MMDQLMDQHASVSTRHTIRVSLDACGSTVNKVLTVRGAALMSAVKGKRELRARSAVSLSVVESGSCGEFGSLGMLLGIAGSCRTRRATGQG
jgi:hypothetical protein